MKINQRIILSHQGQNQAAPGIPVPASFALLQVQSHKKAAMNPMEEKRVIIKGPQLHLQSNSWDCNFQSLAKKSF